MSFKKWLLASWMIVATAVVPAAADVSSDQVEKAVQFPVEKYELQNGLTVILVPDSTIPEVSVQTWYRVGSKDEKVGRTGLAHFFEHMMFKGTPKFPKETFNNFLNSKGADKNAFTSFDYTGYYITAPSEHLELLFQIESDRMRNLNLDPKEVTSEREVVKEERRVRFDDNITGGIHERMASLMFQKLPYRWLMIGSMDDLNAASMDDLRAFYKQFYSPNNAVLVVVGAYDTAQAKRWIETYYASLPREKIVRPEITQEPEQKAARRAVIHREAQAPTVAIGYRLPPMNHPDYYALDLLSLALGQGDSSRLHEQLVYKKEMATSASAYAGARVLAGDFDIFVGLKPKMDPEAAIKTVEKIVQELRTKPISQKELDKARNMLMKDYVDELKRISGRAHILAYYQAVYGDYTKVFTDLKKYQAVTIQDVQRVAKKYLAPEKRNIVIVMPRKSGGSK